MAECPCSNITIMQLFHELKQKFPAVPDRVVTECIKQNVHDKEACEAVLSRENQTYSFPSGRVCKMAAESNYEACRPNSLQLEDAVWDFNRQLTGRQSLDSLRCSRGSARRMCKQFSEEFLNSARDQRSDEHFIGSFSRLSVHDECWSKGRCNLRYQEEGESASGEEAVAAGQCERTRVSVHSAPVTPSNYPAPVFPPLTVDVTTQRHCTKVNMEPAPHYHPLPEPSRPYTSVNLTLRPPSTEPQPPIDISSTAGGLTYSSCSYDPRQGYQSRLQISIGAGGHGSVTAARTLAPPQRPLLRPATSLPDVTTTPVTPSHLNEPSLQNLPPTTKALVREQLERKERLAFELQKYKERLRSMQQEVSNMTADWQARMKAPTPSLKAKKLREEIVLLQTECNRMAQEVYYNAEMRHVNTETLPLGETSEEFYKNIYRGQLFPRQAVRHRPAVVGDSGGGGGATTAGATGEGRNWTCHVCTFHNHPALNKCEQCDMPRIITGAETQNIHIHVTHHNVPSSPYRRVVHSWVV